MKTIGLIGGMSWESSLEYYRIINETVKDRLGGLHSAKILMYSVDFYEIEILQREGKWEEAREMMCGAAARLEKGGADFLLICTNTMHRMADEVGASIGIPLLHIADAAGAKVRERGLTVLGLLGTRFTMEQDFYRVRLKEKFGLEVLVPDLPDREFIHHVIYNELCLGRFLPASRERFVQIAESLRQQGAQGIVLGCTEIPLLLRQEDTEIPLFNTMKIHAEAAAAAALS